MKRGRCVKGSIASLARYRDGNVICQASRVYSKRYSSLFGDLQVQIGVRNDEDAAIAFGGRVRPKSSSYLKDMQDPFSASN